MWQELTLLAVEFCLEMLQRQHRMVVIADVWIQILRLRWEINAVCFICESIFAFEIMIFYFLDFLVETNQTLTTGASDCPSSSIVSILINTCKCHLYWSYRQVKRFAIALQDIKQCNQENKDVVRIWFNNTNNSVMFFHLI
jgi:hypothetical protein